MSILGRRPNPELVARQLIEGLESGALVLNEPTKGVEELAHEAVGYAAEIEALSGRLFPSKEPSAWPTVADLLEREQRTPGAVRNYLDTVRALALRSRRTEAELRTLSRRIAIWSALLVLCGGIQAAVLIFSFAALSSGSALLIAFGSAIGLAPTIRKLVRRARVEIHAHALQLSALPELTTKARTGAGLPA